MQKNIGIYKIANKINGKFYIGSSNDIKDRWREHRNALNQNKHHSNHLQRAWNKYGEENFEFEIIEEFEDITETELREREKHYLETLKPYKRTVGYNVSRGTQSCILYGEDNGFYGKRHSNETKRKMIKNHADVSGVNNPMYGKRFSEEHRMKISRNRKGKNAGATCHMYGIRKFYSDNPNSKKVICLTTNKIFNCIREAGEFYNIKSHSHITSCCKGKRTYCGKLPNGEPLQWMYYEDYLKQAI